MYTFPHKDFGKLTVHQLEEEGFVSIYLGLESTFPRVYFSDIGALEAFRIHLGLKSLEQVSDIVWQKLGMAVSFKVRTPPIRNQKNYARKWSQRLLGFTQQRSTMRTKEFSSAWKSWVENIRRSPIYEVDDYDLGLFPGHYP